MNRSTRSDLNIVHAKISPVVAAAFLAASGSLTASANNTQFKQQIMNGTCCVPNLSHGYHPLRLRSGRATDGEERVVLGEIIFGQLDGKPVAIAIMSDDGGGSGVFNSLLLYEQQHGKAVMVGSHYFGDRAIVRGLRFEEGRVHLVTETTIPPQGGRHTVDLARKDFDKAECLQQPLAPQMKRDVEELVKLWEDGYGEKLSPAGKRKALAICKRHSNDRAVFARAFMLTLGAKGWMGPDDPAPLQFTTGGNPAFYLEDTSKKLLLDLTK